MRDHHYTLWTHGSLRCVLVTEYDPLSQTVVVFTREQEIRNEPCADPDAAALIAERLWTELVECAT